MADLTPAHKEFLVKAARWIKGHRELYCPITAVKHIPNWESVFKDLQKRWLVQPYKGGEVVFITEYGWAWIAQHHPEIAERHRPRKKRAV